MKNLKFHLTAIAIICLIVVVLYVVIGPKPVTPQQATPRAGDRQVHIYSATWGENCNGEIERLSSELRNTPQKDASGKSIIPKPLVKVQHDNVLERVGTLCNNRFACELTANTETLGINPIDACYKDLVIIYRCFDFDRPTTLTFGQGDTKTIDCLTPATANAPTPAP